MANTQKVSEKRPVGRPLRPRSQRIMDDLQENRQAKVAFGGIAGTEANARMALVNAGKRLGLKVKTEKLNYREMLGTVVEAKN